MRSIDGIIIISRLAFDLDKDLYLRFDGTLLCDVPHFFEPTPHYERTVPVTPRTPRTPQRYFF
jgi:hypothetical protein